ncbi:MAG: GNAT family N-acetyltransferase [Pirellulales bacterium]|nr:GNAT family N-acetyltransferase [Pirellulales bacterium]
MIIRSATPDDLSSIVRFNSAIAEETEGILLDNAVLTRGVATIFDRPELGRYFIAELEGSAEQDRCAIGQALVTTEWSDWRNGRFWWLQSVYVHRDHRRQGVFSALFASIRQLAREDPTCCGLRLYVEKNNRQAQQAYRKLGMQTTGYLILADDWSSLVPE